MITILSLLLSLGQCNYLDMGNVDYVIDRMLITIEQMTGPVKQGCYSFYAYDSYEHSCDSYVSFTYKQIPCEDPTHDCWFFVREEFADCYYPKCSYINKTCCYYPGENDVGDGDWLIDDPSDGLGARDCNIDLREIANFQNYMSSLIG